VRGKNDFAEGSKILLNTDLKIILLDHHLKNNDQSYKYFDILAANLNVQLFC